MANFAIVFNASGVFTCKQAYVRVNILYFNMKHSEILYRILFFYGECSLPVHINPGPRNLRGVMRTGQDAVTFTLAYFVIYALFLSFYGVTYMLRVRERKNLIVYHNGNTRPTQTPRRLPVSAAVITQSSGQWVGEM